MNVKDLLQKKCPQCGHPAVAIRKDRRATRLCKNGHQWIPLKNPEPRPEPKEDKQ